MITGIKESEPPVGAADHAQRTRRGGADPRLPRRDEAGYLRHCSRSRSKPVRGAARRAREAVLRSCQLNDDRLFWEPENSTRSAFVPVRLPGCAHGNRVRRAWKRELRRRPDGGDLRRRVRAHAHRRHRVTVPQHVTCRPRAHRGGREAMVRRLDSRADGAHRQDNGVARERAESTRACNHIRQSAVQAPTDLPLAEIVSTSSTAKSRTRGTRRSDYETIGMKASGHGKLDVCLSATGEEPVAIVHRGKA